MPWSPFVRPVPTPPRWGLRTAALFVALGACSGPRTAPQGAEVAVDPQTSAAKAPAPHDGAKANAPETELPEVDLGPIGKLSQREHPVGRAWVLDGAKPRREDIGRLEHDGRLVVDLSDSWVPYIFSERTPGQDDPQANSYRERYVALANDRTDDDGEPLEAGKHNHLELYGIPPSLSVVLADWRFARDVVEPCLAESGYDPEAFSEFPGTIAYAGRRNETREVDREKSYTSRLRRAMRKQKLDFDNADDLARAAEHRMTKRHYRRWLRQHRRAEVLRNTQIRLSCERMYATAEGRGTYIPGAFDFETTMAIANFEKKHNIMGWGHLRQDDVDVLARSPQQVAYDRMLRVLQSRVIDAAGILEDGSAGAARRKFRWKDAAGKKHAPRNLVAEFTDALVAQLGLEDPESAFERFESLATLDESGFTEFLAAINPPELPEYYGSEMEFSAIIHRGDVHYDLPYDAEGNKLEQKRKRYPHLTLFVHYREQRIPIAHWRTTIGAWRREMHEGKVMLKYKNSDVGERVWKDIVAAPVWVPPKTTPVEELLKKKYGRHGLTKVVNYDETGPGYKSAYGLVAGYHIRQVFDRETGEIKAELDNQIRTHGSVDYMSILRRYSHGCHRLLNTNAVRMFSFILKRAPYTRHGQTPLGYRRAFEHEEKEYRMALDTRGYRYELTRPIPVKVLEGRVVGKRKTPYEGYVEIPQPPEDEELEGEGAAEPSTTETATSSTQ